VRRNGGRIVKHLGDGLMLVFPDAASGMRAAVELVEAPPEPLKVRAGMHTGQVIVTADDLIGHVVNTAARVTAIARGGQVLVTGDTLEHAGEMPDVWTSKPRPRALRGVTAKMPIARAERLR
jgi:adenylate cyclase